MKCKIFMGTLDHTADDMFNEWMKDHRYAVIVHVFYRQARFGDHSICIFYNEDI